jgi:signal transduction histidine kinase
MRWTLRWQLFSWSAFLVLAAVLGVVIMYLWLADQLIQQQLEQRIQKISVTLSGPQIPLNQTVLDQLSKLSGAEYILLNKQRNIIAASLPELKPDFIDAVVSSQANLAWHADHPEWQGIPYVVTRIQRPALRTENENNQLLLLYSVADWQQTWHTAWRSALIWGLTILLGTLALTAWWTRRISQPLQQLNQHYQLVATGNYQPIEIPSRNDEWRDLFLALNKTTTDLANLHQQIQTQERLSFFGQVTAGMVHNLRNDITGARMAIEVHQTTCTATADDSLRIALRQLVFAEDHLQQYLSVGQPLNLQRQWLVVDDLLREVADNFTPTAQHRRATLILESQHRQGIKIWGDANLLRQALLVLLLNSLEACETPCELTLNSSNNERDIRFEVIDPGPGLPAHIMAKLFEPFVTSKTGGKGLGLSSARQIAQAHHGELSYRRETGRTIFTMKLPLQQQVEVSA